MEQFLTILTVDLIINQKLRLVEVFLKSAYKSILGFYLSVYEDLKNSENFGVKLPNIDFFKQNYPQILDKSVGYYHETLLSKMKASLKYSRYL